MEFKNKLTEIYQGKFKPHKKKLITLGVIIVLVILLTPGDKELEIQTQEVVRDDLVQEVSLTGTVESKNIASLAFETSGKVASILASENQQVKKGQTLLSLNTQDLNARRAQAYARYQVEEIRVQEAKSLLEVEKSKLIDLESGAKPSDVYVSEQKVWTADTNVESAVIDLERQIQKNESDYLSQIEKNYASLKLVNSNTFNSIIDLTDIQYAHFYGSSANSTSLSIKKEKFMKDFFAVPSAGRYSNYTISGLKAGLYNEIKMFDESRNEAKVAEYTQKLKVAVSLLRDAFEVITYVNSISEADKTEISANLTSLNTDYATLTANHSTLTSILESNKSTETTKSIAVDSANSALNEAKANLESVKSGASKASTDTQRQIISQKELALEGQKASARAALAGVSDINAEIAKRILRSPFDGLVSRIDIDEGEIAFANTVVAEVITESNFEILANIPESDIAKVKIGDKAAFDLDAYSINDRFEAEVVRISESASLIEGVPVYEVKLIITSETTQIKSGMTANIDIATDSRENVLSIPSSAVEDGKVKILLDNGMIEIRTIKLGMKSSDARIEVIEGLNEGELVITYMEEEDE